LENKMKVTDPVEAPPFAEQIRALLDMFNFEQVHATLKTLQATSHYSPDTPDEERIIDYLRVPKIAELRKMAEDALWDAAQYPAPVTCRCALMLAAKDEDGWLRLRWRTSVFMLLTRSLFTVEGRYNGDPLDSAELRPRWGDLVS
jgi:hypothetical protein